VRITYIGPMNIPIPSEKGAIEEIIWQLSLKLSEKGFEVSIYNPIASNVLSKFANSIILRGNSIWHFHDLVTCVSYNSIIRNSNNTLLSLHYPPWITKSKSRFIIMYSILKYLKHKQTLFIAPSKIITKWLKSEIGGRALFIPNGVDTSLFNPSKRNFEIREKLLEGKEILICYVARIHPDKNQLDLLRAVKKLVSSGVKNFKLVFIGPIHGSFGEKEKSFSYFNLLQQYIKKYSLEKHVKFLGELPHKKEVATYMASSDIYCHSAVVEAAAPLTIMEALASGLSVVSYNLIYYNWYLKNYENSILVEKNDVKSLANALETLITQPDLRKRLGRCGRVFAEKKLAWENIVEEYYIPLYKKFE